MLFKSPFINPTYLIKIKFNKLSTCLSFAKSSEEVYCSLLNYFILLLKLYWNGMCINGKTTRARECHNNFQILSPRNSNHYDNNEKDCKPLILPVSMN